MKQLFTAVVIFFLWSNCLGQIITYPNKKDSTIIQIKSIYNGKGKILSDLKSSEITDFKNRKAFHPSRQDILKAEQILAENYYKVMKAAKADSLIYTRDLRSFYRQYITFKDSSGNKKIYLLVFSCSHRNVKRCFPDWENSSVFMIHGEKHKPIYTFLIDLHVGSMELY